MSPDRHSEPARWRVLTAHVPEAIEDDVAAVLGGGSLGVEIASAGPGTSALRVYLGLADDDEAWRARACRVLEAHGVGEPETRLSISPVTDGRWVERWQASLAPIPLGQRFVVLPHGGAAGDSARIPVRLVPGMAFGTGEHPTTRMCAAALERLVAIGSRWLDLGTGSGILAVVAARCGARRVLAVDLDPEAAHVAAATVSANDASAVVEVRAGSMGEREGERFDGVVANIQSSFFLVNAQALVDAVVPGGRFVLSGFLGDDVSEMTDCLAREGAQVEERADDGPWSCLVLRRSLL